MTTVPPATVLIIDDDPFFLQLLCGAYRENGFVVFSAHDGIEGLKVYLDKLPQVVITDLLMPRMGGVSTCMEIRRRAGDQPPILILLTSMFQEAPHEHDPPDMGASYHIPKTCSPLDIVILVEQLLTRNVQQPANPD